MAYQGSITLVDLSDGQSGSSGINTATVYIYKRSDSPPNKPVNTTDYTFADGSFTMPTGWNGQVPTSNGNPCYVCSAVAISRESPATLEWSTPVVLVEDGADGQNGVSPVVTPITNGVTIYDPINQVTYTITDGSDGISYYTYVLYSVSGSPTSASDVSSNPDGKEYVGIQTTTSSTAPPWNDSGWNWVKYVGDDGAPGQDGQTGPQGVSITETRELYYLKTNSATVPQVDAQTQISNTDVTNAWTSIVPTYTTGTYYTCIESSLSNNTKVWSAPAENKGLTTANSNAASASAATALLGGHFIYKSTTSASGLTPPSANVVQTIEKNNIDVTDDPTQWGYNTHIGANGIKLRLNETDLIHLSENGLNIYKDGESVAVYGDDSRIGKIDGAAFYINDNSLLGYYMRQVGTDEYERTRYFTVNSNGIFYGADTDNTRTITRQELNGELQSITNKIELINNDMQTNIDLIQSNLNSINSDLYDSAPALSTIKDATNMVNNYLGNGKVLNWNSSNSTLQLTNTIFNIQMLSDRIVFQKNNQTAAAIRDDVSFHINDAVINNTERLGTNFQWVVGTNRLTLMRI